MEQKYSSHGLVHDYRNLDQYIQKLSKNKVLCRGEIEQEIERYYPKLISQHIPLHHFTKEPSTVNVDKVLAILKAARLDTRKVTVDKYQRVTQFVNWMRSSPLFPIMFDIFKEIERRNYYNKDYLENLYKKMPQHIYDEEGNLQPLNTMSLKNFLKHLNRLLSEQKLSNGETNKFQYYFAPYMEVVASDTSLKYLNLDEVDEAKVNEMKLLLISFITQAYNLRKDNFGNVSERLSETDKEIIPLLSEPGYTFEFLKFLFRHAGHLVDVFQSLLDYGEKFLLNNGDHRSFLEAINHNLLDFKDLFTQEETDTRICETVEIFFRLLNSVETVMECECKDK